MESELNANLNGYEQQLISIQAALQADPDNEDLKQLDSDLQQLITLTTQSLLEEKKRILLEQDSSKAKIKDKEELSNDLAQLVGMKCRAPHKSKASLIRSQANAMIFQVEKHEPGDAFEDISVRVIFCNPTSCDMVACPFFLDGRCRFGDDRCKYSHGEVVKLFTITEFEDPDYAALTQGSRVLAKGSDSDLWRHATVEALKDSRIYVRFVHNHKEIMELSLEAVLPLEEEAVSNDDEVTSSNLDAQNIIQRDVEDSFSPLDFFNVTNGALGEWEAHTKGIGFKLMAKMGYIVGNGLGKRSEGRVEPVNALVYPSGKSLDWCMERREKAGNQEPLTVEKKLQRLKQREERRATRAVEPCQTVFDFINKTLGGKRGHLPQSSSSKGATSAASSDKQRRQESIIESSNVQSFRVSEEMRRVEKEISRLESCHQRHRGKDASTAKAIKTKLEAKKSELHALRSKDEHIKNRRALEDNKKKLTIF